MFEENEVSLSIGRLTKWNEYIVRTIKKNLSIVKSFQTITQDFLIALITCNKILNIPNFVLGLGAPP